MHVPVRRVSRSAFLAALFASLPIASALPVRAADEFGPLVDPRLGPLVHRTVERAAERFGDPGCAMLLTDFADVRSGQPLADTLATSGRTASAFLASLRFIDADHMVQCTRRSVYAWVPVGGDVVFVCKTRFAALLRADERLASDILVHEALHSLGLSENPPSSLEITEAVIRRCGR